jgi:hypothetical protein
MVDRSARRGSRAIACLVLLAALLGAWPTGGASAGCAGPVLAVGPVRDEALVGEPAPRTPLRTGQVVTVSGLRFFSGCDDTGQGTGCGAPASEQVPLTGVQLVLRQAARSVNLGTADAAGPAQGYAVSWQVRVPSGFVAGPAVLEAAGAQRPVVLQP